MIKAFSPYKFTKSSFMYLPLLLLMNSRILRFLVRLLYVFILKKKKNTCYILCSILCEFSNFERWVNYDPPFPKRTHVPFAYKKYRETFVVICICMELFRYFSFRYILTQPVYILKCLYILFFATCENCKSRKAVLLSVHDWKIQRTVSSRNWMIRLSRCHYALTMLKPTYIIFVLKSNNMKKKMLIYLCFVQILNVYLKFRY